MIEAQPVNEFIVNLNDDGTAQFSVNEQAMNGVFMKCNGAFMKSAYLRR